MHFLLFLSQRKQTCIVKQVRCISLPFFTCIIICKYFRVLRFLLIIYFVIHLHSTLTLFVRLVVVVFLYLPNFILPLPFLYLPPLPSSTSLHLPPVSPISLLRLPTIIFPSLLSSMFSLPPLPSVSSFLRRLTLSIPSSPISLFPSPIVLSPSLCTFVPCLSSPVLF